MMGKIGIKSGLQLLATAILLFAANTGGAAPRKPQTPLRGYMVLESTALSFSRDLDWDGTEAVLWKIGDDEAPHLIDKTAMRVLRALSQRCGVKSIDFNGAQFDDDALRELPRLSKMKCLNFVCSNIDDKTVAKLDMSALRALGLYGTKVTDAGLKNLDSASGLQILDLGKTQISGSCLQHIGTLKQLRQLGLGWTEIQDGALASLRRLDQLDLIELQGTKISDKGIALLAPLQPRCYIRRFGAIDIIRAKAANVPVGTLPLVDTPRPLCESGRCDICEALVIESLQRKDRGDANTVFAIPLSADAVCPPGPEIGETVCPPVPQSGKEASQPSAIPGELQKAIQWKKWQPRPWETGRPEVMAEPTGR